MSGLVSDENSLLGLHMTVSMSSHGLSSVCPQRERFILIGSHDRGGLQGKPAGWRPRDELSP